MNVYVVVEGRIVEKEVYTVWIPQVNKTLSPAVLLTDVSDNNFFIVSGNGYPQYLDIIHAGLEDVASTDMFDRLVICVDSENMSLDDKRDEIAAFVNSTTYAHIDYRVVVQHFCFETWALGNRRIGRKHPAHDSLLGKYRGIYNVLTHDPEGLPALVNERLNRSQFAEKYLRVTLNDRNKNLSYSKHNPSVVAHPTYFSNVRRRLQETGHISSFQAFIDAFA